MIHKLPENAFVIAYQITREKFSYLDKVFSWEESANPLKFLWKPRDPYPDLPNSDFDSGLLQDALNGSFPDLGGYHASPERPDAFRCSALAHMRKGEPPMLEYQVWDEKRHKLHKEEYRFNTDCFEYCGDMSQTDVANGRIACGKAMDRAFRRLDFICHSFARELDNTPEYSRKEKRKFLRLLDSYREEVRQETCLEIDKVTPITTLNKYIDYQRDMLNIAREIYSGDCLDPEYGRRQFRAMEHLCNKFERDELAGLITEKKRQFSGFDWDVAETVFGMITETDACRTILDIANHFGMKNIMGFLEQKYVGSSWYATRGRQDAIYTTEKMGKTDIYRLKEEIKKDPAHFSISYSEVLNPTWDYVKNKYPEIYSKYIEFANRKAQYRQAPNLKDHIRRNRK